MMHAVPLRIFSPFRSEHQLQTSRIREIRSDLEIRSD